MNQAELVKEMAIKSGMTQIETKKFLEGILDAIEEALIAGEKVKLQGFGSFEVRDVAERVGVNPTTKEKITISARKRPVFKASKALKDLVNGEV